MIRSEAIADIKRGTGFRPSQEPTIIAALKSAQRTLETGRSLPKFLIAYNVEVPVTADNPIVALPERFLRFHDDYDFYYTNSYGAKVFLPRRDFGEAYQAYVASGLEDGQVIENTPPTYGSVIVHQGPNVLIVPTPTVSYSLYLTYYRGAVVLDTDVENEWLANNPEVLIGLAGMQVATILRDKDGLAGFTMRYKLGEGSKMGKIVEDELAGRGLVMGRNK